MNWDAIGAVGEILGAIAVLVTLILLLRQIRQNTNSLQMQSLNSTYEEWVAMTGELQTQPALRSAYLKDQAGEKLDDDEFFILVVYFIRMLNSNDKMYHMYQQGAADSFNFENIKNTLFALITNSGFFENWWRGNTWRFSKPFQQLVDNALRDPIDFQDKN